jgi:hypothetical protein
MAGAAKATIDHEEIRSWVESHGGKPSAVIRTGDEEDVGIIRIDFPGFSGEGSLQEISWDDWFAKFEESELAFLYQDDPNSNFNKLVKRETVAEKMQDQKQRKKAS